MLARSTRPFLKAGGRLLPLSSACLVQRSPFSTSGIPANPTMMKGEILRHSLDIRNAAVGDVIDVPYEITTSNAWRVFWQASFYQHDRLYTSNPFAKKLHLEGRPLPFSLMLTNCVTMSHLDDSKNILDLSFNDAVYVRPAYVGQTFKKQFVVSQLAPAKDGRDAVATFQCNLIDAETDLLVFTAKKSMIIADAQLDKRQSHKDPEEPSKPIRSEFLTHLEEHASKLEKYPFISPVESDQIIIHQHQRMLGLSEATQLSTLARLTYPVAFNTARHGVDGMVLFGALTLANTLSLASVKLYETLYETLDSCLFVTKAKPRDCIGAVSLISNITTRENGLEELTVHTLGLKNVDVVRELRDCPLPRELFTAQLKPSEVKQMCEAHCPALVDKVVVQTKRKLLRQTPMGSHQFVPLL